MCVAISPEETDGRMQLKNCISPSAPKTIIKGKLSGDVQLPVSQRKYKEALWAIVGHTQPLL